MKNALPIKEFDEMTPARIDRLMSIQQKINEAEAKRMEEERENLERKQRKDMIMKK